MGHERSQHERRNAALYVTSIAILLLLAAHSAYRLTQPIPTLYDDAYSRWFYRTSEWISVVGYSLIGLLWELTRRRMKARKSLEIKPLR